MASTNTLGAVAVMHLSVEYDKQNSTECRIKEEAMEIVDDSEIDQQYSKDIKNESQQESSIQIDDTYSNLEDPLKTIKREPGDVETGTIHNEVPLAGQMIYNEAASSELNNEQIELKLEPIDETDSTLDEQIYKDNKEKEMHHSIEKPYVCEVCNKSFGQKSTLRRHIQIHSVKNTYMCNVCNKCFSSKSYLDIHSRTHTGGKLYKCKVCNKCFVQKSQLESHSVTHNTEKSYKGLEHIDCCLTDYLLTEETLFPKLSYEKKMYVINTGRARPNMTINYKRKDGFSKHFHVAFYEKYTWLTGSCKLNKMFCFPCLLFSDSRNVWSTTGFTDINNIVNSAKKHVQTEKHVRSCLSLHEFGNTRVQPLVSNDFESHNRNVDRNRKLMKRLIDTVVLLGKQAIAFGDHDEGLESANRGNYIETLSYLCKYDSLLDLHFDQCSSIQNPVFSGFSKDIQNELIHCIATVIRDEIKSQINNALFVSAVIDEAFDVTHREQLTVIIRYLTEGGIEERFLGFYDVSGSRTPEVLSSQLLEILDQYSCREKLVGQSYDASVDIAREHGGVHAKVREVCPRAIFVPCYAHVLNLVLCRSLENIPELKMFFGDINSIIRFFNESTKRSDLLEAIADGGLPETRWQYHSRIIHVIFNCKSDLINTFNAILDDPQCWDCESVSLADNFLSKLENMQFCFFLHVLAHIFEKTDVIFNVLQSDHIDIEIAKRNIDSFENWIYNDFKHKFEYFYESIKELNEPPRQQHHRSNSDTKTMYRRLFIDIIDNVSSQIKHRHQSLCQLTFLDLLDKSKYSSYSHSFPDDKISTLLVIYPNLFKFTALKNELKVLYTTSSLNTLDVRELFINLNNSLLSDTFPQVLLLCNIFLTIPVTVAYSESSLSAFKRVHTYLSDTQKQERSSDLAIISVEKHLLLKLQSQPSFYDNVLNHFLKTNRQILLEYK